LVKTLLANDSLAALALGISLLGNFKRVIQRALTGATGADVGNRGWQTYKLIRQIGPSGMA
jgi:hypothetical protein